MTDDELRKLAEAALADLAMPVQHTDAGFCSVARTREPELARAVLRLLEERDHHHRRHEAIRFQAANEGCVAAHVGERTYECDATKPCGLCRLRSERNELARYKAAVKRVMSVSMIGPAAHSAFTLNVERELERKP